MSERPKLFKRPKSDGLSLAAAASAAPRRAVARGCTAVCKAGRSAKICLGGARRAWDVAAKTAAMAKRTMVTRICHRSLRAVRKQAAIYSSEDVAKLMLAEVKTL